MQRTPLGVAERPLHSFLANARTFRKAWSEKGTFADSDGKKMDGKWDLMGFYRDLMGFYSDLMGFYSDSMGYNGIYPAW